MTKEELDNIIEKSIKKELLIEKCEVEVWEQLAEVNMTLEEKLFYTPEYIREYIRKTIK